MKQHLALEAFIKKSKSIHGDKLTYEKCNYIKMDIKVLLTCKIHGDFLTWPRGHLQQNVGCPECSTKNHRMDTKYVIDRFQKIYGDLYDYSKFTYTKSTNKSIIICKKHGEFNKDYTHHYHLKQGCPKCGFSNSKLSRVLSNEEFIIRAKLIHGDLYDYSDTIYFKYNKKLNIFCNRHGIFSQSPNSHLRGEGCPECKNSKGEKAIELYLRKNKIEYKYQYSFQDCRLKRVLPFDFYLPKNNILVEFDGEQHYRPIKWFGGEIGFKTTQKSDNIKNKYCTNNNIKLIRIKYNDYKNINKILKENI